MRKTHLKILREAAKDVFMTVNRNTRCTTNRRLAVLLGSAFKAMTLHLIKEMATGNVSAVQHGLAVTKQLGLQGTSILSVRGWAQHENIWVDITSEKVTLSDDDWKDEPNA